MKTYDPGMARQFSELLDQREAQLRALLPGNQDLGLAEADGHEVVDQKDAAARDAQSTVQQAQTDHAAHELRLVEEARHRLQAGGYGQCLECGEAMDVLRLTAMPAAALCTPCQARHERAHADAHTH